MGQRPVWILLASHWLSLAGAAIVTTAVITWALIEASPVSGTNPYLGILTSLLAPIAFFLGLILMPIGVWRAKKRIQGEIDAGAPDRARAWRRIVVFLGATSLVNVALATQFTYRAVEYMESRQFCGETCHAMQPEFRAAQAASHSQVGCVECHVAPGAEGWVASKMAGTRQLFEVIADSYARPIPSAMESNRLVPSWQTCENCHDREKDIGDRLRVLTTYAEDETNTKAYTVLLMHVGGRGLGGIHGAHLDPNFDIRYVTPDAKRQDIPWVKWRNRKTGETRDYFASGADKTALRSLAEHEMQCVDCHNRPAHTFESANGALNRGLSRGEISADLPFIKSYGAKLLAQSYGSALEAQTQIPAQLAELYMKSQPAVYAGRRSDIERAGAVLAAIYGRNVFPDLKVDWGTYVNNLGHTDAPGCFRCHDADHSTEDGLSIAQDCFSCHQLLSVEEPDPEILQKLNGG